MVFIIKLEKLIKSVLGPREWNYVIVGIRLTLT